VNLSTIYSGGHLYPWLRGDFKVNNSIPYLTHSQKNDGFVSSFWTPCKAHHVRHAFVLYLFSFIFSMDSQGDRITWTQVPVCSDRPSMLVQRQCVDVSREIAELHKVSASKDSLIRELKSEADQEAKERLQMALSKKEKEAARDANHLTSQVSCSSFHRLNFFAFGLEILFYMDNLRRNKRLFLHQGSWKSESLFSQTKAGAKNRVQYNTITINLQIQELLPKLMAG